MSVVAMMRELVAKGMSWEDAACFAEKFEEKIETAVEQALERVRPVRSANAERQARFRARRKEGVTDNVTRNATDNAGTVSPTPPSGNTPFTPLKGGVSPKRETQAQPEKPLSGTSADAADEPTPSRGARRKPNRPLPDGFPTAELIQSERDKAILAGVDLDATREAERFRNHAHQTDRRCADWTAAWRNWTLKAREWAPKLIAYAKPAGPDDPWPSRLLNFRVNGYWDSDWGPKPGRPDYRGPPPDELAA